MRLGNCCSEDAVSAAVKKHFPTLDVQFNTGLIANNDLQLDLLSVFQNFPGENIDYFDLTNPSAFEARLKTLSPHKIYCVRTGQNNGSGHFSFMHFEKDKWILSTGPQQHETLATGQGQSLKLNKPLFQHTFSVDDPKRCGSKSTQFSVRINELTPTRTIAAMNYIAMFRAIPGIKSLDEITQRQSTEVAVIDQFQPLVNTDADALFLKLTPEAARYWGKGNHELPIVTDKKSQRIHRQAVYQHLLCVQNNPEYLHPLLDLGFQINEPVNHTGNTLLHLAVEAKSLQAVRRLLFMNASTHITNKEGLTAWNLLQRMEPEVDRSEILQIRNCFSNTEIESAIAAKAPPKQLTALLREACHWNNYSGIALLLAAGADVLEPSKEGKMPIEILINMAIETNIGWGSIEDALFHLLDKMMEKNPAMAEKSLSALLISVLPGSVPLLDILKKSPGGKTLRELAIQHNCQSLANRLGEEEQLQKVCSQFQQAILKTTTPRTATQACDDFAKGILHTDALRQYRAAYFVDLLLRHPQIPRGSVQALKHLQHTLSNTHPSIQNKIPRSSPFKTIPKTDNPIINTITIPPTTKMTTPEVHSFINKAITQHIDSKHSRHYKSSLTPVQTSGEQAVQLTHSPDLFQPAQVLLTAKPDTVQIHRAFITDKHIQREAKIMMILQALGIPPKYPEKLYISKEKSNLGQEMLKKYYAMKAEHDQSLSKGEDPSSSL